MVGRFIRHGMCVEGGGGRLLGIFGRRRGGCCLKLRLIVPWNVPSVSSINSAYSEAPTPGILEAPANIMNLSVTSSGHVFVVGNSDVDGSSRVMLVNCGTSSSTARKFPFNCDTKRLSEYRLVETPFLSTVPVCVTNHTLIVALSSRTRYARHQVLTLRVIEIILVYPA